MINVLIRDHNVFATFLMWLGSSSAGWSESLLEFRSGFGEKMKVVSKKRWKSLGPLHLKSKSVARFCFFSKLKSNNHGPGRAPVYLNVYDLTPINGYIYWAGLGIFHSGVEGKL